MGKFDSYKIDLRGMKEVNASYDLSVDNEFFAHIDGPEVQKGKVQIALDVHRSVDVYEMNFVLDGVVKVNCDRCLDEMDLDIHTKGQLQVKLGADYGEQGDVLIIHSDCYAKSVQIEGVDGDLLLEDNFFDIEKGEKRVRILSGKASKISLRSVFDIR